MIKILGVDSTDFDTEFMEAIDEVKTRLGSPVIQNNIDDQHIEIALQDSITYFAMRSPQGTIRKYLVVPVTEEIKRTRTIDLNPIFNPPPVDPDLPPVEPSTGTDYLEDFSIYAGIHEITDISTSKYVPSPSIEYQEYIQNNFTASFQGFSISDMAVMNIHRAHFFEKIIFSFNRSNLTITINANITALTRPFLVVEMYLYYHPKEIIKNNWVIRYATALAQITWGKVASKYKNMYLAGGIELDGLQILADAKEDKQTLLAEFYENVRPLEAFFY